MDDLLEESSERGALLVEALDGVDGVHGDGERAHISSRIDPGQCFDNHTHNSLDMIQFHIGNTTGISRAGTKTGKKKVSTKSLFRSQSRGEGEQSSLIAEL
jgi:hypothetical protein